MYCMGWLLDSLTMHSSTNTKGRFQVEMFHVQLLFMQGVQPVHGRRGEEQCIPPPQQDDLYNHISHNDLVAH